MKFSDLNLDPQVLRAVEEAGYTEPTPIQAQAIPHALEGRDVLGIAQTGTGKTASFTLPMITILAKGRARARMPRSLILCPTRELAAQVAESFETYGKYHKLTKALLIGGVSFKDQDRLIDRGVDVLIATPGRLLDHFERGKLLLTGVQIMVVDEADRMLDMGFIPDLERIFKLTPFTRQTLFFSATMPPEITRLTEQFLHNPVRVEVAPQASAPDTVEQGLVMLDVARSAEPAKAKRACLRALIRAEGEALTNAIIFCNRKRDVGVLHRSLVRHGHDAGALHGDLDQSVRMATLEAFRDGRIRLLVASDVAARGLDIPNVSHVFNFDVPIHAEDYVHRIGRTGRAGREGKALTIATRGDARYIERIEKLIGRAIPRIEPPEGMASAPSHATGAPANRPKEKEKRRRSGRDASVKAPARGSEAQAPVAATGLAERAVPVQGGEAEQAPTTSPERAKEPARRAGRGTSRKGGGGGSPVIGMGDHVPAFIMRPIRRGRRSRQEDTGASVGESG